MHMKFEIYIPEQTEVTLWKPCHLQMDGQTDRRTRWIQYTSTSNFEGQGSAGSCDWPLPTCTWSFKLKFQSILKLHSGNHVTYRWKDRLTDKVNPVYSTSNFLGQGYNYNKASKGYVGYQICWPLFLDYIMKYIALNYSICSAWNFTAVCAYGPGNNKSALCNIGMKSLLERKLTKVSDARWYYYVRMSYYRL